jgi:hypothetical protein
VKEPSALSSERKQQSAFSIRHSVGEADARPGMRHPNRGGRSAFLRFTATVVAAFREIFDESAYARFLARHRMTNTREAYALYLRESNLTRERRPRCC